MGGFVVRSLMILSVSMHGHAVVKLMRLLGSTRCQSKQDPMIVSSTPSVSTKISDCMNDEF